MASSIPLIGFHRSERILDRCLPRCACFIDINGYLISNLGVDRKWIVLKLLLSKDLTELFCRRIRLLVKWFESLSCQLPLEIFTLRLLPSTSRLCPVVEVGFVWLLFCEEFAASPVGWVLAESVKASSSLIRWNGDFWHSFHLLLEILISELSLGAFACSSPLACVGKSLTLHSTTLWPLRLLAFFRPVFAWLLLL